MVTIANNASISYIADSGTPSNFNEIYSDKSYEILAARQKQTAIGINNHLRYLPFSEILYINGYPE